MVTSQDTAAAVALTELGYDVTRPRGRHRDRRLARPTACSRCATCCSRSTARR